MIPSPILQIIKNDSKFKKFLEDIEFIDVSTKRLEVEEIKRLSLEYPNLLSKKDDKIISIICLTLVKNNLDPKSYDKLKKIKIYIDETNENIIKILQN